MGGLNRDIVGWHGEYLFDVDLGDDGKEGFGGRLIERCQSDRRGPDGLNEFRRLRLCHFCESKNCLAYS